jgi:uncharacterized membrane protein
MLWFPLGLLRARCARRSLSRSKSTMADPVTPTAVPTAALPDPTPPPSSAVAARTVDAGRGAAWWSEAWRLFAAAPGPWLLIVLILLVLNVVLLVIPVVGHIAMQLLYPVFAGGLLLGCRAIDRGQPLTVNHLFAGFGERTGPLLILGLLYLCVAIAITLAVAGILLVFFGAAVFSRLFQLTDPFSAAAAVGSILTIVLFGMLLFMLLFLPLFMAIWFAPALVVLRGLEPWAAMKASLSACLKNVLPFLIYGLVGFVLAIVASIPLMLGWLVLGPLTIASVYTGYCDIFEDAAVS